jgi:hypothetical protein
MIGADGAVALIPVDFIDTNLQDPFELRRPQQS